QQLDQREATPSLSAFHGFSPVCFKENDTDNENNSGRLLSLSVRGKRITVGSAPERSHKTTNTSAPTCPSTGLFGPPTPHKIIGAFREDNDAAVVAALFERMLPARRKPTSNRRISGRESSSDSLS